MANPVLINDLRRNLFRRKPVLATAFIAIAILVLTFIAEAAIVLSVGQRMRYLPLWNLPDMLLPVLVPAFAAGSFAKEHEQRTWDDLRLTLLGSWEIIRGKFMACLIPTIVAMVVLFPAFAMLLMVQGVTWAFDFGPWILIVLIKFLINAFFYISLIMFFSCFFSNGRTALAVSYILLAVYLFANFLAWQLVVPSLYFLFYDPGSDTGVAASANAGFGYRIGGQFSVSPVDLAGSLQALAFGTICLIFLRSRMQKRG